MENIIWASVPQAGTVKFTEKSMAIIILLEVEEDLVKGCSAKPTNLCYGKMPTNE